MNTVQLVLTGYFSTTTVYHSLVFAAVLVVGAVEFTLHERRQARGARWRGRRLRERLQKGDAQ